MEDDVVTTKSELQMKLDEIGREVSKKIKESDAARASLITVILIIFLEATLFAYFLGRKRGKRSCKKKRA